MGKIVHTRNRLSAEVDLFGDVAVVTQSSAKDHATGKDHGHADMARERAGHCREGTGRAGHGREGTGRAGPGGRVRHGLVVVRGMA